MAVILALSDTLATSAERFTPAEVADIASRIARSARELDDALGSLLEGRVE